MTGRGSKAVGKPNAPTSPTEACCRSSTTASFRQRCTRSVPHPEQSRVLHVSTLRQGKLLCHVKVRNLNACSPTPFLLARSEPQSAKRPRIAEFHSAYCSSAWTSSCSGASFVSLSLLRQLDSRTQQPAQLSTLRQVRCAGLSARYCTALRGIHSPLPHLRTHTHTPVLVSAQPHVLSHHLVTASLPAQPESSRAWFS